MRHESHAPAGLTVEVLLLGTGAADGIPNPFCRCETCSDHRDRGELRTPTSVLVDGRLLIDPGPEAPRQVSRLGRDLLDLAAILAGHAHNDHLDASVLMHRSWVTDSPLRVVGPEPVVSWCRQWLPDGQAAISFTTVTAGDRLEVAGYAVSVLAANHEAFGEAVGYLIDDGAAALLYLSDTGPLPASTLDALTGRRVDLVLLEETFGPCSDKGDHHLNLTTFASAVAQLRARGTIADDTRVVAVHLGHDNPPPAELAPILRRSQAEALPDGTVLIV